MAGADPKGALSCVHPLDAAGIDRVLTAAGSPLAGQGTTFVNAAASAGLDPRALVAIAGHETILQTYGPANAIHNAFGIGPGRAFATDADAISFAANLLAKNYVGDGRRTLDEISGKWAPLGVANDPTNLNANWVSGVGTLYGRLGGNPDAPITLDNQPATDCAAPPAPTPTPATPSAPAGSPAAGVVAWNGTPPVVTEALMERGADPAGGGPASVAGFVFPYVPAGTPIRYTDDFSDAGATPCFGRNLRCAITLDGGPNTRVVAAIAGQLQPASPAEQATGIAFWIFGTGGDRIGYSGLASYQPNIAAGAVVTAGQEIGMSTRVTQVTWERAGQRINPFALLSATRVGDA